MVSIYIFRVLGRFWDITREVGRYLSKMRIFCEVFSIFLFFTTTVENKNLCQKMQTSWSDIFLRYFSSFLTLWENCGNKVQFWKEGSLGKHFVQYVHYNCCSDIKLVNTSWGSIISIPMEKSFSTLVILKFSQRVYIFQWYFFKKGLSTRVASNGNCVCYCVRYITSSHIKSLKWSWLI